MPFCSLVRFMVVSGFVTYSLLVSRDNSRLKKRRQFCKHMMSEISSLTHPANQIWSIWLWFQTWYFPRIVARLHCPRWPGVTRGTLQERRPPRRTRERARLPTSRLPMQGWRKSKGWPGTVINLADLCCDWWLMIAWSWYCRDAEIMRQKQQKKAEAAAAGGSGGSSKKWGYIASCNYEERDRTENNRRLGILWHPLCENESYYIVINKL